MYQAGDEGKILKEDATSKVWKFNIKRDRKWHEGTDLRKPSANHRSYFINNQIFHVICRSKRFANT